MCQGSPGNSRERWAWATGQPNSAFERRTPEAIQEKKKPHINVMENRLMAKAPKKTKKTKKTPKASERKYELVAINEKSGRATVVSSSPLTHKEATTMKSKFTVHKKVRLQLREI